MPYSEEMKKETMDFSRRDFLKGAFAMGGIVASSRLPLHARGNFEQLSLAYAHIDAGAEKPFSVLHISDTHLTFANPDEDAAKQDYRRRRTELFGGRQFEALKDSIRWAKINADYLIHTGDLVDWVSEGNMIAVQEAFGPDAGNVFGSIGNHEYFWPCSDRKPGHAECFARCSKAYPYNLHFGSQVINGVNFVSIDDAHDDVTQDQVELFAKEVKKGLPIIMLMHVPFPTPRIVEATRKYWAWNKKFRNEPPKPITFGKRGQEFIKYLKSEPLLKGILAGHMHITVEERFSPTAVQYLVAGNFAFAGREVLFT
jgi:predicted MPP superfamily phosphohydrolase